MLWQKILTLAKNHLAPMVFYSFVFPFLNGLQAAVANPRKVSLRHTAIHSRYLLSANKQRDDELLNRHAVTVSHPLTHSGMTKMPPRTVIPPRR